MNGDKIEGAQATEAVSMADLVEKLRDASAAMGEHVSAMNNEPLHAAIRRMRRAQHDVDASSNWYNKYPSDSAAEEYARNWREMRAAVDALVALAPPDIALAT